MRYRKITQPRKPKEKEVFDKWKDKLPRDTIERTLALEGKQADPALKAIYDMWRILEKGR